MPSNTIVINNNTEYLVSDSRMKVLYPLIVLLAYEAKTLKTGEKPVVGEFIEEEEWK